MRYLFFYVFTFFCAHLFYGQRDSIIVLEEVVLSDSKLLQFSDGVKVTVLSDTIFERNSGMLTNNLQFNTPIYFKQNGYGMVSSASFRGTSAQQTAVVWNGININSQLTGQTDFNSVMAQNFDDISIRSGGGSTQYGTGAVGGSIHLNQKLNFEQPLTNGLRLSYGSFDTSSLFYKIALGTKKYALNIGVGHISSDNDYKYLGTERKNENGFFANQNVDVAFGYLVSDTNLLKIYHNTFIGNRDFSGTLTAPSNDNYKDINTRSLVEWTNFKSRKTQRIKAAYVTERYRYFANKERDEYSFGKSKSLLFNYDYLYKYKQWKFNGILEANAVNGEGSSIENENRNCIASTLLVSNEHSDKLKYGFAIRKDWVSDYTSPVVFSLDASYTSVDTYSIRFNASKNYRIPTFNDLYWVGSGASGNAGLLPENSLQAEIGQSLKFKQFNFSLTGFYIATNDLIQWRPNVAGNWSPINIEDVTQFGLEIESEIQKKYGKHQLQLKSGYAYTSATSNATKNQLIYVPYHKFTSNFSYSHRRLRLFIQGLYNGTVFTTTDNNQDLDAYLVINSGLTFAFPKKLGVNIEAQIVVNNLGNKNYQNVAFRPMPNRNIHFNLNFKF